MTHAQSLKTPVGDITLAGDATGLTHLNWEKAGKAVPSPQLAAAAAELAEYFAGKRKTFTLKLNPKGTPFQQKVWQAVLAIPYGKTVTYGDLAKKLKTSPRAVGGAVGANPLAILIPCHRVMGANGAMTGYSGGKGIPTKEKLLALEQGSGK